MLFRNKILILNAMIKLDRISINSSKKKKNRPTQEAEKWKERVLARSTMDDHRTEQFQFVSKPRRLSKDPSAQFGPVSVKTARSSSVSKRRIGHGNNRKQA